MEIRCAGLSMFENTIRRLRSRLERRRRRVPGTCNACGRATFFLRSRDGGDQREAMHCAHCHSQSRKRHMIRVVLALFAPGARSLAEADLGRISIYSTVSGDAFDRLLRPRHSGFVCSELFPDLPQGHVRDGVHCQDLERLTFGDASFDLVLTEDVLEHVRQPEQALREIRRVLKPGGYHVFTIPYHADRKTVRRVDAHGQPLLPAEYHYDAAGNRVLVCTDWGYDLFDSLAAAGFATNISVSSWRDAAEAGIADSIVFFSRRDG